MKKWLLLTVLAVFGFSSLPASTEACWRQRRRCVPCYPVCQPLIVYTGSQPYVSPALPSSLAAQVGPRVTIGRKTYVLLDTTDQGQFSERPVPPSATASGVSSSDTFSGHDRLTPKTTIVQAPIEDFDKVAALVSKLLDNSSDAQMRNKGITPSTNTRVAEENHTVRVTGFIHAFKKEGDNDYHVILGDGSGAATPVFLNVEVSGIPVGGTNDNRNALIAVREKFKQTLNLTGGGPGSYKKPHEPIPVRITGPLFWDVDHAPGVVGPENLKPRTSWEIHPVSVIEFLDEQ